MSASRRPHILSFISAALILSFGAFSQAKAQDKAAAPAAEAPSEPEQPEVEAQPETQPAAP